MIRGMKIVAITAALALMVGACAPLPPATQAPEATATAAPQVTDTAAPSATETTGPQATDAAQPTATGAASGGTLQPPSAEVCNSLAQGMMQALPGVEVTQAAEPVAINDVAKSAGGTACRASASGTGETFKSPIDTVNAIAKVLAAAGWEEDMNLIADGPTGTATGYRKGSQLCLIAADWNPGPAVTCPADKPISECNVPPAQQIYDVTLDCATTAE